jgi:hypothetical protein
MALASSPPTLGGGRRQSGELKEYPSRERDQRPSSAWLVHRPFRQNISGVPQVLAAIVGGQGRAQDAEPPVAERSRPHRTGKENYPVGSGDGVREEHGKGLRLVIQMSKT